MDSKTDNLTLLCEDCRQVVVLGEVSSDQVKMLKRISNILLDYSNWLEARGIVVKEVLNDEKKKQVLLQAFVREKRKSLRLIKEEKQFLKKNKDFLE